MIMHHSQRAPISKTAFLYCIGARYAMQSMKIMLITILRRYRFTTDMTMDDMRHDVDLVLKSFNGWKIKLYTRRN